MSESITLEFIQKEVMNIFSQKGVSEKILNNLILKHYRFIKNIGDGSCGEVLYFSCNILRTMIFKKADFRKFEELITDTPYCYMGKKNVLTWPEHSILQLTINFNVIRSIIPISISLLMCDHDLELHYKQI